jgi:hypothetical protein
MVGTIYQYQCITRLFEDLKDDYRNDVEALLEDAGGSWVVETRANTSIK